MYIEFSEVYVIHGVWESLSQAALCPEHAGFWAYVFFLTPVAGASAVYNFYQMVTRDDVDLTFEVKISTEASNFKLGFAVQSIMVGFFCFLAFISEIVALAGATFFHFMQKEMSRAITHALVSCFSLGFCGGFGIYCAIIEMFFAVVFYITATAEAWNPPEGADTANTYEPSTQ